MLVKYFHSLDSLEEFEFAVTSIKEVLCALKYSKGADFTDGIITNDFKYVLVDSTKAQEPIALMPEVLLSDFGTYDTLIIMPSISGEVPVAVVLPLFASGAAIAAGTVGTGALIAAGLTAAAINIAIAVAVSAIVSAISPTPEYDSDPSGVQANLKQSNLFNGAPLIREQGGIVPLILGNPFCGGVLISSGVHTEDV